VDGMEVVAAAGQDNISAVQNEYFSWAMRDKDPAVTANVPNAYMNMLQTAEFVARGFRPRVREVDGVPAEQMARVHGKLIAHGLLQVEITGRTGGMLYQLTTSGRRACLQIAEDCAGEALESAFV